VRIGRVPVSILDQPRRHVGFLGHIREPPLIRARGLAKGRFGLGLAAPSVCDDLGLDYRPRRPPLPRGAAPVSASITPITGRSGVGPAAACADSFADSTLAVWCRRLASRDIAPAPPGRGLAGSRAISSLKRVFGQLACRLAGDARGRFSANLRDLTATRRLERPYAMDVAGM